MKRFQAIEFEDYSWFPSVLRNCMTDFYQFQMTNFKLYDPAAERIANLLAETNHSAVYDLCSGGSGPWQVLHSQVEAILGSDVQLTLTDKFPNIPAFNESHTISEGKIGFKESSVDATQVPDDLLGVRTLFSSFHHFPPTMAVSILQDAVDKNQPIAVFELSNRTPSAFFQVTVLGFLSNLFLAPLIKPRNISRFVLTYLIPLIPLVCVWDGIASNLRAYSTGEFNDLIKEVKNNQSYDWEVGTAKAAMPGVLVTYLQGKPKSS